METGSVVQNAKAKCSQKRKTVSKDSAYLVRKSVKDPRKTSDATKTTLREKGTKISSFAILARLLENGRKTYRLIKN